MKQTVHLYFHELAFAIKQNRVGLQGNYMEHLCQYFVNIQEYQSPIDPEFELPYNFVIKKYADASDLPPDPSESTLIFLPLNLDILRYIQNNKPELLRKGKWRAKNLIMMILENLFIIRFLHLVYLYRWLIYGL